VPAVSGVPGSDSGAGLIARQSLLSIGAIEYNVSALESD
jgi:hypothetical protein